MRTFSLSAATRFEFIAWVQAPGIENERGRRACTISRRGGTIRHEGEPGFVQRRASKCPDGGGAGTESAEPSAEYELRDVVEPALAKAVMLAAEAQQWVLVAQIAAELTARRRMREGQRRLRGSGGERCTPGSTRAAVVKAAELKLGARARIR